MNKSKEYKLLANSIEVASNSRHRAPFEKINNFFQEFNEYNINYQPYSLSHLLALDLSDKSAKTNSTQIPSKNNTPKPDGMKQPKPDTAHTALLQPIAPNITEAF